MIKPSDILSGGEVLVTLDVKNTGKIEGKEVVQLYINDDVSSVTTPFMQLRGFQKISLARERQDLYHLLSLLKTYPCSTEI